MTENIWRGIILVWSLLAAGGVSLTYIMFRAAQSDLAAISKLEKNEEFALLGRRVMRAEASRLVIFIALLLAAGALWTVPASAGNLADIIVRVGFGVVFVITALILFVIAVRDLMDTLNLLERSKPLETLQQATSNEP